MTEEERRQILIAKIKEARADPRRQKLTKAIQTERQKQEMRRAADDFIKTSQGRQEAFARGLQDAVTLGRDDELVGLMMAPFAGYDEARGQALEAKRQSEAEHPLFYGTGQGVGFIPAIAAGTKASQALIDKGMAVWKAEGLVGMGEGYAAASGDERSNDLLGAGLGGFLGVAGGAAPRAWKALSEFFNPSKEGAEAALGRAIFDETAARSGEQLTPDRLMERAREIGPHAIGADLHPALRVQTAKAITEGADDAAVGKLASAVESRDLPTIADESFLDVFGDPGTRHANKTARKDARAKLAAEYERVLQHHDARPTISTEEVYLKINDAFEKGVTPVGTRKQVLDRVSALINAKGQKGDQGFSKPFLTLRDAVDLQHELDAMIAQMPQDTTTAPAQAVSKLVRSELIEARRALNEVLKSTDDDFRAISAKYVGDNEIADASRIAEQTFRSPNAQLAGDTAVYYNSLSDAAKEQFRAVAVYEIARKSAGVTPQTAMNRASGTKTGDALADTVRVVFGDGVATRLLRHADSLGTMQATNNAIDAARAAREGQEVDLGEGSHLLKTGADLFTVLTQAASGRVNSGPFAGAARRGITELGSRGPRAVNTARAELGAKTGEDLATYLRQLYFMRERPPTAAFNLGVLGGVPDTEQ